MSEQEVLYTIHNITKKEFDKILELLAKSNGDELLIKIVEQTTKEVK